jgi:hypothetical protein
MAFSSAFAGLSRSSVDFEPGIKSTCGFSGDAFLSSFVLLFGFYLSGQGNSHLLTKKQNNLCRFTNSFSKKQTTKNFKKVQKKKFCIFGLLINYYGVPDLLIFTPE